MPRDFSCRAACKWFGWVFIAWRCVLVFLHQVGREICNTIRIWLMGFFFGVLHLAYGAYLYLTEKGKNAA